MKLYCLKINAFVISLTTHTHDLINMCQSNGCVCEPGFMHSLTENAYGDGLTLASNTIRTLVLVALSLITGLCGM